MPFSIGIKPNFIKVPHLRGYLLNIIEVRGGVYYLLQRWMVFRITPRVFNFVHFFVGLYIVCGGFDNHCSITCLFSMMLRYIKHIFWNIIQASLGSIYFPLLWLRPDNFIVSLLNYWLSSSTFGSYNDFAGILYCGTLQNLFEMNMFT